MRIIKCAGYYGQYTWEKTLYLDDDDDRDPVKVAIAELRREGHMTLGMATCNGHVVSEQKVC